MQSHHSPEATVTVSRGRLEHEGRQRTYTVVRPSCPELATAVVLMLHGTLQTGDSLRRFSQRSFDSFADGRAVVVYPDAVHREWNGARRATMLSRTAKMVDDVGFLERLAAETGASCAAGPLSVFCVGFSLGGQMTIRLVHDAPGLLAGAALIAANMPAPDNLVVSNRVPQATPVLSIHGTADPLAPYDGGQVSFHGRFEKGLHLSAADTARYFAQHNGIDTEPTVRWLPAAAASAHPVSRTDYCQDGRAPVSLCTVVDGGHQIPGASAGPRWLFGQHGSGFSAPDVIAEFFGLGQDH
jgi:polyhydroxybutyrate depolymerase